MLKSILVAALAFAPHVAAAQDQALAASAPAATEAGRNASALVGPLAVGATVRDSSGQTLGRISRLTTGADGQTVVMLRKGVDSFSIPANRLHLTNEGVVSDLTRDGIKALSPSATR